MRAIKALTLILLASFASLQTTEGHETDIAGVTADIAFLRQYDGVLHLGVILHNPDAKEAAGRTAINFADISIVDAKANKKLSPLKDANGHFLAGPISDWNGGGRWFPKLMAKSDTLVW